MVIAALTVAGWVASPCLRYLGDVVGKYLQDQYEYQKPDVRSKLQSLKREMTKIYAVIHEAEKDRIENPALKTWLLDLKDACSDAEDMLDMFEYRILQDKVENMDSGSFASGSRKAYRRARKILKLFVFCDDELRELFRIVDRFKQLAEEMGCFINLVMSDRSGPKSTGYQSSEERMPARCSTSISTEPQLFGRDEERTGLIEKLGLKQGKEGELIVGIKDINVISIVGIGGMGKTTLVQSVYNDEGVRKEFDLIGWVCVSDKFEVRRLMTEMIDSLNIKKPDNLHSIGNLEAIQRILKDGLEGKRFLIVLDDIWERDPGKWEVLRSTINFGKEGSRVIITTRNESIANMMAKDIIHLKGLDDVQYWKLFVRTAFGDVDPDERPDLVSIGQNIVKKLGGLPLAAKVVGGVLNLNMNIRHWNEILTKEVWQVDELEERIISVLRLSYDYLPAHLKQCFVYCSLFHKDHAHKKDDLIQLWAAQGFIQPNCKDVSKTMETTGENYLDELVSKSFLQKKIGYNDVGLYFIHDLLHDLAIYLSDEELFKAEDAESDDTPLKIPKRVRHMSIHANHLSAFCNDQIEKKNLRSLVVHHCSTVVPKEIFKELKELKGLRVLILNGSLFGLPTKTFRQMFHLRYLKIHGDLEEPDLQESICKLYHLQVLSIGGLLPKRIYRLINLRFVNARTGEIQNVGRLTFLHELEFSVDREKKGFEISQLGVMSQLRRLEIYNLERVKSVEEASKAKLCTKTNLDDLQLRWGQNGNKHSEVLEGLKPHKNLRRLVIEGYSGRCPSWLMGNNLENLQRIDVMGCSSWNVLPPMGHLPLLRVLVLDGFPSVEQIGPEFYGGNNNNNKAFPSLERLTLREMPELVEWRIVVEGLELFPRLSDLTVDRCPKLRGPLCLPSPLKRLCIYLEQEAYDFGSLLGDDTCFVGCPSSSRLKEWVSYAKLASVEEMEIRAGGTTFLDELEEWFQHLTSLKLLRFTHCSDLQSLPYMLVNNHPALCKLEILSCNAELAQRCRKDGADWHKIAHIPNIGISDSLWDLYPDLLHDACEIVAEFLQ